MRVIRVESITYSTVSVVGTTIPLTIGDRSVNLRIRRCAEDTAGDPIRLSIRTSTTQNLPRNRQAQGYEITTRQIPGGSHVITIEPKTADGFGRLDLVDRPSARSQAQIWPDISDLLDELLPEYRFV